eukprot:5438238-Amphidinium_carterae.1
MAVIDVSLWRVWEQRRRAARDNDKETIVSLRKRVEFLEAELQSWQAWSFQHQSLRAATASHEEGEESFETSPVFSGVD